MLSKWYTQYVSKFGKLSRVHRTGKCQFSFHSPIKAKPKTVQTTTQMPSSHTLAKSCSKFYRLAFNITWTVNFQMFQLDLEKAEEWEIKLSTSTRSSIRQESSRNTTHTSALLTMAKLLTMCITTNCGKFFKRWGYHTTCLDSWEICMLVRMKQNWMKGCC